MHKQKPALALVVVVGILGLSALFSHFSTAQVGIEEIKNAILLQEYFLPIQAIAPIEEGKVIIGSNECSAVFATTSLTTPVATRKLGISTTASPDCATVSVDADLNFSPQLSPDANTTIVRKTTSGIEFIENNAAVSYNFTQTNSATLALRLGAFNAADSLSNLTKEEYTQIIPATYNFPKAVSMIADEDVNKEIATRSLVFQVSLDTRENVLGVVALKDSREIDSAIIDLGVVPAGEHTLFVTFANDLELTLPTNTDGSAIASFADNDLDGTLGKGDGKLAKRPVLSNIELLKTQRTNDVVGVRIYTNPLNLPADAWYQQNLVNPGVGVPYTVDGYHGVIDGRTAYVNAANVTFNRNDAKSVFYTNIYVIAHNVNASSKTIEIFSRIISNWKFNKNIIEDETDAMAEQIKGQLRRDVQRLEDVYHIKGILEAYKSSNGKYPQLTAGTYDPGHVISTWPTWQSVLGNEVGALIPADPINMMTGKFYPRGGSVSDVPRQYDCTDDFESTRCQNVCSRGENNTPLLGCPSGTQCVADAYCSVVPVDALNTQNNTIKGFDGATGWSEEAKNLYFRVRKEAGTDSKNFYDVLGKPAGYNTAGKSASFNDDAFVYQYTSLENGNSYALNYRFEYEAYCAERRLDGSCKTISSSACGTPGSCLIPTETVSGVVIPERCIAPGDSPYTNGTATVGTYENIYCFAGSLINSCGNGILEANAGEVCEFNQDFSDGTFCDARYGGQSWYNEANISDTCTSSCKLATTADAASIPLAYNQQQPGLSCGGFCGDRKTQFEFKEQCDQGAQGGEIDPTYKGGSAGISADAQYACTATTNVNETQGNLVQDFSFESNKLSTSGASTINPTILSNDVIKKEDWIIPEYNRIFDVSIENTLIRPSSISDVDGYVGDRSLRLTSSGPTAPVIYAEKTVEVVGGQSYILTAKVRKVGTATPDFKLVVQKIKADGTLESSSIIDAYNFTTESWQSANVTEITTTSATKYIRIVPQLYASVSESSVLFDNVSLTAALSCQTIGGYCGDGIVQSKYGEQCDSASFIPPTPQRSVDQIINGGFESGTGAWYQVKANALSLISFDTDGNNTAINLRDKQLVTGAKDFVYSGFRALTLSTGTVDGVVQKVAYQPKSDGTTTIDVEVFAKKETNSLGDIGIEARAYQYDFVSGELKSFTTGQYLSIPLTTGTPSTSNLSLAWSKYTGRITIPAPTATELNQVTALGIFFNGSAQAVDVDSIKTSSSYQLNYACVNQNNRLCQLAGGFCGDGVVQSAFGEECDLGSVANGTVTGKDGKVCSQYCSAPFCGDGVKGVKVDPQAKVSVELCDASDPSDRNYNKCNFECSKILPGGFCSSNSQCTTNRCTITRGETEGRCASEGLQTQCSGGANDCPAGMACDESAGFCRPTVDAYLRHHLDVNGYGLPYDTQSTRVYCPKLKDVRVDVNGFARTAKQDECTGLIFYYDNTLRNKTFEDAVRGLGDFVLPTVKQLYTLVVTQTAQYPSDGASLNKMPVWPVSQGTGTTASVVYTDNLKLKTQSVEGRTDERYAFWTSTGDVNSTSIVDLKRGSVDKVDANGSDTTSASDDPRFNALYVLESTCGDGIINGLEQCDFAETADQGKNEIFTNSGKQESFCSEYVSSTSVSKRFTQGTNVAGKVHCDVDSCKIKYDNCAIVSSAKEDPTATTQPSYKTNSCATACSDAGLGAPKSLGVNLVEQYPHAVPEARGSSDVNAIRNKDIKALNETVSVWGFDDSYNDEAYKVAADGQYVNENGEVTTFPVTDLVQSLTRALTSSTTTQQSIGFYNNSQDRIITGTTYPTSTTNLVAALGDNNTNKVNAPAFLCACEIPALPDSGSITGVNDDAFVEAYITAEALVITAEGSIGNNATFDGAVAEAQSAITALYTHPNVAAKVGAYLVPVDTLQSRLNLAVENAILQSEQVTQTALEAFSKWSLDEDAGRLAYNSGVGRTTLASGAGAHITFSSCTALTCTQNIVRKASVSGQHSYIELDGDDFGTTTASYLNPNEGTISLWVKGNTSSALTGTLWYFKDTAGHSYELSVDNGIVSYRVTDGASCTGSQVVATSALSTTTWNHIAVTYKKQTTGASYDYALYINNVETTGSNSCVPLARTAQSLMYVAGKVNAAGGAYGNLSAKLDDIYVYDTAKPAAEINTLLFTPNKDLTRNWFERLLAMIYNRH